MLQEKESHERIFTALQHLKHNKHEVLLFHVGDYKTERDFEFEDRKHQFIDLETGQKVEANPWEIRDYFQKQAKQFLNALKIRCGTMKIDLITIDISEPFEKVLSAYLIKRKKMK